jgi:hypothetical protein
LASAGAGRESAVPHTSRRTVRGVALSREGHGSPGCPWPNGAQKSFQPGSVCGRTGSDAGAVAIRAFLILAAECRYQRLHRLCAIGSLRCGSIRTNRPARRCVSPHGQRRHSGPGAASLSTVSPHGHPARIRLQRPCQHDRLRSTPHHFSMGLSVAGRHAEPGATPGGITARPPVGTSCRRSGGAPSYRRRGRSSCYYTTAHRRYIFR